ncbi:hypothetical protein RM553_18390 [Zunongwangia sp. F363]|uniref:Chlorophyllase n=1 Tax=Autumnicola tepida TaxID=3075595 RepID=A0ABU3CET2_9FLAO|nr:hypothetical protein [Zunongwangia sp. F363]MDT0644816.1 hypothetical protein [Zunongwangia sp. F363]
MVRTFGNFLKGHINRRYFVAAGHSLGGNVAIISGEKDKRIRAAVNLDGGTFIEKYSDPKIPTLTIRSQPDYTEEEIKDKRFTLKEWDEMGKNIDSSFNSFLSSATNSYEIKITGAGHMSFSDAPFVLPKMITRFGGKIIDSNKAWTIINKSILLFFTRLEGSKFRTIS